MIAGLVALTLTAVAPPDSLRPTLLDDFERITPWSAHPADGVTLALRSGAGRSGRALRMDFGFTGGGYAIARRALPLLLPDNYALSFWIRGIAPPNTLEFKLVDRSGDNVWWYTERDRRFDGRWQKITIRKRQLSFAWGPLGGGELREAAAVEIVITAGAGGGRGSVWLDDLRLTPLPELGPYTATPAAGASGAMKGHPAAAALDGDTTTSWRAPAGATARYTVDFRRPREFGGLSLLWEAEHGAPDYDVQLSDDRLTWRTVRSVRASDGGRDDLDLPESESRYLRLVVRRTLATGTGLRELVVQPLAFGASRNAYFEAVATNAPPGAYPRYYSGRRAWWTVVGVDGAREEALINDDGAVEAGKGLFSVEPFLLDAGRLISWHDVQASPSLDEGDLPIPSVTWAAGKLALQITAVGTGPVASSSVMVRYRVVNHDTVLRAPTLALAVRPFQVNPPSQFLNTTGGYSRIDSLRWIGGALRVNADRTVQPLTSPAGVTASTLDGGDVVQHRRQGTLLRAESAHDPEGAASALLRYPLSLAPGDSADVAIEIPLVANGIPAVPIHRPAAVDSVFAAARSAWREAVTHTTIGLPPSGADLERTIRTTQAWILINRDGPSIQPGSRSYERSWIRDGALTSAALLRFGHPEPVRAFLDWFTTFQYPDGKVPCCVDARGADPVPEHDSNGEYIYLVMEYWRHTGDRPTLERMWPHVVRATNYLDSLRQTRRTTPWTIGDNRVFYGLLPASISHEGYSAKPMHSYWDDFFALRGFKDAAAMAELMGDTDASIRFGRMRDEFRVDLLASLALVRQQHAIDFLPGAADLGDFDATSTTIALSPGGEEAALPPDALHATFERYWREASARADSGSTWEAYTPYELRTVGAMLRLGWADRARAMLYQFLNDREPQAWNQWPEVVWHDSRVLKFIGDSPHTWVGSDFLRSAADLFGYEREADSALVVGAGIDPAWLEGEGVRVHNLRTWWGPLSYVARREGDAIVVQLEPGLRLPPGGIVLALVVTGVHKAVLNGSPVPFSTGGGVLIRQLPAQIRLTSSIVP